MDPLALALRSLDGLSVGDAFGERFFVAPAALPRLLEERAVPRPPWRWTDDTAMALDVVAVLRAVGAVDPDALATAFARRHAAEPDRGYGRGAHEILDAIHRGEAWRDAAGRAFGGQGSLGNGAAMRVAPLGAYFARAPDDQVAEQAARSARVTHAHPDGQAGAVAVAAAAAWAARNPGARAGARALLVHAHAQTPASATRDGLTRALELPFDVPPPEAAAALGSGARVASWDTVPFSLWCAARHADDFREALWATVSGLGDRDTTCAIVGGVVALSAASDSLPPDWLRAREPLPL